MSLEPVVVYGAGGFGREVVELMRDINTEKPTFEIVGFLDDDQGSWGRELNDLPILGGLSWLEQRPGAAGVVLGFGAPHVKRRVVTRVRAFARGFPVLIHPNVVRSKYIACGDGVVITAGNILTANIQVGAYAMLNLACTVGHDSVIGEYATLSPGVNVSGNVRIGAGCDVGTGAKIVPGVDIGEWSIVGAGAVVSRDLPANCTAVGVPAKSIKERAAGWQLA